MRKIPSKVPASPRGERWSSGVRGERARWRRSRPRSFGFSYPTRMVLIKLSDGRLFVWSPVALSATLKRNIDTLGPMHFLISPNRLHHLFLVDWKSAFPQARVYASRAWRNAPSIFKLSAPAVVDLRLKDGCGLDVAHLRGPAPGRRPDHARVHHFHHPHARERRAARSSIAASCGPSLALSEIRHAGKPCAGIRSQLAQSQTRVPTHA